MRAIKALGQNFLISSTSIDRIISYTAGHSNLPMVEIGPGRGGLTIPLSKQFASLTCIEKDALLAQQLTDLLHERKIDNVTILNNDILELDPQNIMNGKYDLIGSLPFNISKRIIQKYLCTSFPYPRHIFAVVQAEVGEKYTANAPKGSALSAIARVYGSAKYIFTIPRTHFSPIPEVDAAFIHFERNDPPPYHAELSNFIHLLFKNPRKQLRNTLRNNPVRTPDTSSPDPSSTERLLTLRAEQLQDKDIMNLFFMYNYGTRDETQKS